MPFCISTVKGWGRGLFMAMSEIRNSVPLPNQNWLNFFFLMKLTSATQQQFLKLNILTQYNPDIYILKNDFIITLTVFIFTIKPLEQKEKFVQ